MFKLQFLLFLGTALAFSVYAQDTTEDEETKPISKYDIYDFNCDSGGQQNMNICFGSAMLKLDSILNLKYKCLISSLDTIIKEDAHVKKYKEEVHTLKKYKAIIVKSQALWINLRFENAKIVQEFYNGGTIEPMEYYLSNIMDLKDRLRRLDDFIETLAQSYGRKMNCE